ncbi:MAG: 3'-5' exonuclease [Paludibacteraceae bacterium]|nr:3'-5' exonuclease [Paludibacteraceae bacterium]
MKLVCFDTETTGLDVQKEHIIQLSLVKVDTDDWSVIDQRDWYILPEGAFTIPAEAEAVHHISKEFLQEHGVSLRSVYEDLLAFTKGCDFLSYNGNGYDAPILYYNLKRFGLTFDFEGRTWYDALLLERIHTAGQVDENGEKLHNNLTAAYTRYYGHPFEGAHNSLDDVMATIEVFKAQVAAHGWDWAQRDEFGFISYDRWLYKKGNFYYLNQGGHKGDSIESMLRIDRSYLEWICDKCQWTDDQTRDIIGPYIGRYTSPFAPAASNSLSSNTLSSSPLSPSRGKKRPKGTITEADLSLF